MGLCPPSAPPLWSLKLRVGLANVMMVGGVSFDDGDDDDGDGQISETTFPSETKTLVTTHSDSAGSNMPVSAVAIIASVSVISLIGAATICCLGGGVKKTKTNPKINLRFIEKFSLFLVPGKPFLSFLWIFPSVTRIDQCACLSNTWILFFHFYSLPSSLISISDLNHLSPRYQEKEAVFYWRQVCTNVQLYVIMMFFIGVWGVLL